MNNNALNEILGTVAVQPPPLFDNWMTAFLWLVAGLVIFALIALYLNFKRAVAGKHVNKGALPYIKWPLLLASAGFNVFSLTTFSYLPVSR